MLWVNISPQGTFTHYFDFFFFKLQSGRHYISLKRKLLIGSIYEFQQMMLAQYTIAYKESNANIYLHAVFLENVTGKTNY